jgi:hypothetical protein
MRDGGSGSHAVTEHSPQDVRPRLILARAESEADSLGNEAPHGTKTLYELGQQGGPGRRHQFMGLVALADRDPARAEDCQGGRAWQGVAAMGALQEAGSFDDWGSQDTRSPQQIQSDAGAHDVYDRIEGAHLVEMDVIRRQSVDASFRGGDALEDGDRFLADPFGQCAALDQLTDGGEGAVLGKVLVMVVVIVSAGLCRSVGAVGVGVGVGIDGFPSMRMFVLKMNVELGAGDLGLLPAVGVEMVACDLQFPELAFEGLALEAEVEHRPQKHVAADSTENVQVKSFHFVSAPSALIWLAA